MMSIPHILSVLVLLVILLLSGCQGQDHPPPPVENKPVVLRPTSHQDLGKFLASENYDWGTLHEGVPPFILENVPVDLHRIREISEKKRIFFLSLLPMVLMANQEIGIQRQALQDLLKSFDRDGKTSPEQTETLAELQAIYEVDGDVLQDRSARDQLLLRVDIIPPSLVLAQAATESGFGTSGFARRANNLFGEFNFNTGAVNSAGQSGRTTPEIRKFRTVHDSLLSYMNNLNTHSAYNSFRRKRAEMRAASLPLEGMKLVSGLALYSTRGQAYITDLKEIMRDNRLWALSALTLRPPAKEPAPESRAGLLTTGPLSSRYPTLPPPQPTETNPSPSPPGH